MANLACDKSTGKYATQTVRGFHSVARPVFAEDVAAALAACAAAGFTQIKTVSVPII